MEARIIQSFKHIDEGGGPLLTVLRKRLVAELFGDPAGVAATLSPEFELVMHTGGTTTTLPGSAVVKGVEAQAAAGVLMWIEFDHLAVEEQVIAGSGTMCSLLLPKSALTTIPIGLFLRLTGEHMNSEVAFMGAATTTAVKHDAMPSVERLHARLDPEGRN